MLYEAITAKLLSDSEKMVALSPNRMMWGALIGVFSTPLMLVGFWQVYHGLSGANAWAVGSAVGMFGIATVIGAFVHGSFRITSYNVCYTKLLRYGWCRKVHVSRVKQCHILFSYCGPYPVHLPGNIS